RVPQQGSEQDQRADERDRSADVAFIGIGLERDRFQRGGRERLGKHFRVHAGICHNGGSGSGGVGIGEDNSECGGEVSLDVDSAICNVGVYLVVLDVGRGGAGVVIIGDREIDVGRVRLLECR